MPQLLVVAGLVIAGLVALALGAAAYEALHRPEPNPAPPPPEPAQLVQLRAVPPPVLSSAQNTNGRNSTLANLVDMLEVRPRSVIEKSPLLPLYPCHRCGRNAAGFTRCPWCSADLKRGDV